MWTLFFYFLFSVCLGHVFKVNIATVRPNKLQFPELCTYCTVALQITPLKIHPRKLNENFLVFITASHLSPRTGPHKFSGRKWSDMLMHCNFSDREELLGNWMKMQIRNYLKKKSFERLCGTHKKKFPDCQAKKPLMVERISIFSCICLKKLLFFWKGYQTDIFIWTVFTVKIPYCIICSKKKRSFEMKRAIVSFSLLVRQ